jgi:hypothetical protein
MPKSAELQATKEEWADLGEPTPLGDFDRPKEIALLAIATTRNNGYPPFKEAIAATVNVLLPGETITLGQIIELICDGEEIPFDKLLKLLRELDKLERQGEIIHIGDGVYKKGTGETIDNDSPPLAGVESSDRGLGAVSGLADGNGQGMSPKALKMELRKLRRSR